ncbi:F0F1 ATP synthase subunit B [Candidatus Gottesmanbacteria bacterium]|nr:F0F1 ATP synthase subunit B [Candidatus Gottesmanbacteria bacterium]
MEKLGIEPSLLLAQIVNFSIIVLVLAKLLYKPVLSMLEKRRRQIEEGLALTRVLREEEEKLKEKKQKLLDESRREGQAMIEEARKQIKEEEKDVLAAAHQEAERIIEKGREEVVRVRAGMEKDLQRSAVELAELMTKRLLTSVLTSEDKHKVVAKHLRDLETMKHINK